jgi:hypothetical protein
LHDHRRTAADQHPADIDSHRPSSFLRPRFGHLWAPLALKRLALRRIGKAFQLIVAFSGALSG